MTRSCSQDVPFQSKVIPTRVLHIFVAGEHSFRLLNLCYFFSSVVGTQSKRIELSNIWSNQLRDIISFVQDREASYDGVGTPPRMPDVLQASADPLKPSRELREICKENGIEFVSYSTLHSQNTAKNARWNKLKSCFFKNGLRISFLR